MLITFIKSSNMALLIKTVRIQNSAKPLANPVAECLNKVLQHLYEPNIK